MANRDRDINFRIRATDDSQNVVKGAAKNIDTVTNSLDAQAVAAGRATRAASDYYNKVLGELSAAQEKALGARRDFEALRNELANAETPTKAQERALNGLATAAERADKAVAGLKDKLVTADTNLFNSQAAEKKTGEQAKYVRDLTRALDEADAVANQAAFRRIGEDAILGAKGIDQFGAAASASEAQTARMANALRQIIDPTGEATRTLDGLENEVIRLGQVVGNADKPLRNYQDAIYELQRANVAAVGQASAIDGYRQQELAVKAAQQRFIAARDDVLRYGQAIATADAPNQALIASLRAAERALEQSGAALQAENTKLQQHKAVLDAAGISTKGFAEAERRLKVAVDGTTGALNKLNAASKGQGNSAGRFLGLRPYELQNLSFQINDVFTQLASGASVTQTFAQQGGQILQLFPGLFSKILAFAPLLASIGVVAGTAIASITRVLDYEASVRQFQGSLTLSADGARFQATALADAAHQLDVYGTSLENARKGVAAFVSQGFDQSQLVALGKTAQDLADVLGIEVPAAAEMMASAFSGGMGQVDELDSKLNFLSATERARIQDLFDSGQAEEARTEALRIFSEQAQEAADNQRGPWSEAARNLAGAWDSFLGVVGNLKPIQDAIRTLNDLARTVQFVTSLLPGGSTAGVAARASQAGLAKAQQNLAAIQKVQRTFAGVPGANQVLGINSAVTLAAQAVKKQANNVLAAYGAVNSAAKNSSEQRKKADQRVVEQEQRGLDQALEGAGKLSDARRLELAQIDARRRALAAGASEEGANAAAAIAAKKEQIQIDKQAEAAAKKAGRAGAAASRKAAAEARKAAAQAKAEQAKRDTLEGQLINDLRTMDVKVARAQKASLESRLAAVDTSYEKIFDRIRKYEEAGGKEISGAPIADFSAEVNANKEALKQQEQLAFYEETIGDLAQQREATLERINDQVEAGNISAQEGYDQARTAQSDLAPQIAGLAAQALAFAESIKGAAPSPQMLAFIEQMKSVQSGNTLTKRPSSPDNQFGLQQLARQQRELNEVISTRNDLLSSANALLDRGVITQAEFERRARDAYEGTTPLINEQVVAVGKLAAALRASGAISEAAFAAIKAGLEEITAESVYVSERFLEIRNTLTGSFTNGAVQSLETIAQSLANLIRGGQGFKTTFGEIFDALRTFAANFLLDIARMIAQMAILQALQNSPFFNGLATGVQTFVETGSLTAAAAAMQVAAASTAAAGTTITAGATALGAAGTATAAAGATLATGGASVAAAAIPITAASVALGTSAAALQAAATTLLVANSVGIFHGGGIVGQVSNRSRSVSPAIFAGAPRYHSGGVSGLKPDERATILKVGEEVLEETDPRHRNNGGRMPVAAAAAPQSIKIVNAIDAGDMVQQGLSTRHGEKAILNFMRSNARAVNGALNSK